MVIFGLIDIDDFTLFNLSNSFERGNYILHQFKELAKTILCPLDLRKLDADEFIFYLQGSYDENKENLTKLFLESENQLAIKISVGLVESTRIFDYKEVINQLRINILEAKKYGKNKICLT